MPFSVLVTFSILYFKLGGAFVSERHFFYVLFILKANHVFCAFPHYAETDAKEEYIQEEVESYRYLNLYIFTSNPQ